MTNLRADTPLRFVKGIGPQRAEALAAAGFRTAGELLYHLPVRYDDWRRRRPIAEVDSVGPWTVVADLAEVRVIRTRRRDLVILRAVARDGSGSIPVVWFNQPYLAQRLASDHPWQLHGTARPSEGGRWELLNPVCRDASRPQPLGLVAVYPAVRGIGPATMARIMERVIPLLEDEDGALADPLPADLRKRYALPSLLEALRRLHRPPTDVDPVALGSRSDPARVRLCYGELLEFQLELAALRARDAGIRKPHRYRIDDEVRRAARDLLPFRLTAAQKRALAEIVGDLQRGWPMLRLLQGDVGSGKTIVAALSLVVALESGLQGAFMAPTELLAEQHHDNLVRLLGRRYRVGLVSSSRRDPAVRRALAAGEIQLAVGTHALIQERLAFARLGLVVIDEQHRFGVEQRIELQRKGDRPDVLVMTATPIPRSLALTAFGDLEISSLDELPPGRTPIVTEVVSAGRRREVYLTLRSDVAAGAQAYVVFPLIEGSEAISAEAVGELGERIRAYLGATAVGVLHGRLDAAQRNLTMRRFAAGEIRVLLSTTIVEVGVDVPEATVMVIESAERFGLAQLHQLRGRVGRGSRPSRCVALHGRLSDEARRRLEIFASSSDGFRLAEADLELRGPGDLLGVRQSGMPSFRLAHPLLDRDWLERARSDARELVPRLDRPELAALRDRLLPRAEQRARRLAGG